MKTFVVDTSVGAKWFLPRANESLSGEAETLLDSYTRGQADLLVPDLFWAELGNVLWIAVRHHRITPQQAEVSLTKAQHLGLIVVGSLELLSAAFPVALAADRSFYDSLYVAVALLAKADLVTADERLANAMSPRFPVRWLGALATYL
jgi:predicted nucleic acid-binding protein